MAAKMGILSCGVMLVLTALSGFLLLPTEGNVIDQRALQRELEDSSPEIMSMNDKEEFRELEEPFVNDYANTKTKVCNLKKNYIFSHYSINITILKNLKNRLSTCHHSQ